MPKTPLDAMAKKFMTVRFRAGYDRGEVDGFLSDANSEIQRLVRENSSLHESLEAASTAPQRDTGQVVAEAIDEPAAVLALAERQHADFLDFAHAERTRLIQEASETAQAMVEDAERLREDTIKGLKQQEKQLERTNEQLHQFEREHRVNMKALMQEELHELRDD